RIHCSRPPKRTNVPALLFTTAAPLFYLCAKYRFSYYPEAVSKVMKFRIAPLLLLVLWVPVVGQTASRRGTANRKPPVATTPPEPAAQPTPGTPAPAKPVAPIPAVTVNGQTFTTAEFEASLRQELESLDEKISEARRNVVELQINTMLLQVEAKRRGIDTHRLYELEVSSRIPAIAPTQVK